MTSASGSQSPKATVTVNTNLTGLLYVVGPRGTWGLDFKDGKLVDAPPQAKRLIRLGCTLWEAKGICLKLKLNARWFPDGTR